MLVQADDEQIRLLFLQETEYCLYFSAFHDRAYCLNTVLSRQPCCTVMHFDLDTASSLIVAGVAGSATIAKDA